MVSAAYRLFSKFKDIETIFTHHCDEGSDNGKGNGEDEVRFRVKHRVDSGPGPDRA